MVVVLEKCISDDFYWMEKGGMREGNQDQNVQ